MVHFQLQRPAEGVMPLQLEPGGPSGLGHPARIRSFDRRRRRLVASSARPAKSPAREREAGLVSCTASRPIETARRGNRWAHRRAGSWGAGVARDPVLWKGMSVYGLAGAPRWSFPVPPPFDEPLELPPRSCSSRRRRAHQRISPHCRSCFTAATLPKDWSRAMASAASGRHFRHRSAGLDRAAL